MFEYNEPTTISVIDAASGNQTALRARDFVSNELQAYINKTGAVCTDWLAGYFNLSDGTIGDYRDNGVSWLFEEFFQTNWYEGYIWDGRSATARNMSFVPSNKSTYPFLCTIPPAVANELVGDYVASMEDDSLRYYYIPNSVQTSSLLRWIQFSLHSDEFDVDYFYMYGMDDMVARRSLRAIDSHISAKDVSMRLQVHRLLSNRDPVSGRMLMDATDLPDHLSAEERDHPDAQREHMFHGRMPWMPWVLEDGTSLLE